MKAYYIINIVIESKDHYCLWFTHDVIDEVDEPVLEEDGLITELWKAKSFSSKEELVGYAESKDIQIKDEGAVYETYNFDTAIAWLKSEKEIECNYFLNLWNLTSDIANSLAINFKGNKKIKHINKIYDKLFWGCNLSPVTPEGCEYIPIWTKKEMRIITKIVKDEIMVIKNFV